MKESGQAELCFENGKRNSKRAKSGKHEAENRLCARIILEHAAKFGGAESLPVAWARRVLGCEAGQ